MGFVMLPILTHILQARKPNLNVGYGDMVPLSPTARLVLAMEGLFGQLFQAIVIARLVGLEIGHRVRRHDS